MAGDEPRPPSHVSRRLGDGRAGSASPPTALARSMHARGVECDKAKLVGLMVAVVVAQGSLATYVGGQARGIAGSGAL
jgi:hypothetical protein